MRDLNIHRCLGALWVLCILARPALGADVPKPPRGGASAAVLALLEHNRDLCDGIAGKAIGIWRRLGDSASAEGKVRDRISRGQLSELAKGRATTDIIASLLPRTRAEAGAETSASLGRLHEHVKNLCDAVALPTAPRESFEAEVGDVLDRFERQREELGRLLVIPKDELEAALKPYLTAIQLAGFEAESEYQEYLESQKTKPAAKTLGQWMQEWHQGYTQATLPTKQALGKYLQARGGGDYGAMAQACKEVLAAVIPLLRDGQVFSLPVQLIPVSRGFGQELYPPLQEAYEEIRLLAVDCSAGRSREVEVHFAEMQRQLGIAAGHLAKFKLAP